MVTKFDKKPDGPAVPVGMVEVRTFMHKPMCPKCKNKGVSRFLVQSKTELSVTPIGDPGASWWCDHCDYSITLPLGMFPMFEHQEIRLEPVRQPANRGEN